MQRFTATAKSALIAATGLAALTSIGALSAPAFAEVVENVELVTYTLWARQDISGPLRAGNVVKAAGLLNEALAEEGSNRRVQVVVQESPAAGFDDDALQLLRVFGIGEGPDLFIQSHTWICAFEKEGFVANLEDLIQANDWAFGTIFPTLWESTKCGGDRYAIPQDAEARMFFYNKKLMREAGISEEDIESLPARVLAGEVTLDGLSDIAKQVVDNTSAEYGILHRPSVGPDYIMVFNSYGNSFSDPETGSLLLEPEKLEAAFGWFERNVQIGVTPANNTAMEWGDIREAFYTRDNAAFWMYGIWDLASQAFPIYGLPKEEEAFFKDWGWTAVPPVVAGGTASSLTHPIVYAMSSEVQDKDLAIRLLGFASDADLNTDHAVTTAHLAIRSEQLDDPRYQAAWPVARATELLDITQYLPNNAGFADLNRVIYTALQGVETGSLSAAEAAQFVVDEAEVQLDDVIVR